MEKKYGWQEKRFVVADSYDELFLVDGSIANTQFVDIFQLEAPLQELNITEGAYAIDTMTFTIDQSAIRTEYDDNALQFCLGSLDTRNNRYCALFTNPDFTDDDTILECVEYIGKLKPEIAGDDIKWAGDQFDVNIDPIRQYQFTTVSFDVSVFEQVAFFTKIELPDGSFTNPIFDALEPRITIADINAIANNRLAYKRVLPDDSQFEYQYYRSASLYDALLLLFSKAENIIEEITGTIFTIELVPGSLGFKASVADYELSESATDSISQTLVRDDVKIELKLNSTPAGPGWSNPFIHRRMLNPNMGDKLNSLENELSFWKHDNLSDLLYDIARSFGCYLIVRYKANRAIEVKITSREGLVGDDFVYIVDAEKGSINLSSSSSSDNVSLYGQGTVYTVDGYDNLMEITDTTVTPNILNELVTSQTLVNLKEQIKKRDGKQSPDRLLLNTNIGAYTKSRRDYVPNGGGTKNTVTRTLPINTFEYAPLSGNTIYKTYEVLTTGIYVQLKPFTTEQIDLLGADTAIWRPTARIHVRINNVDLSFDKLSDYINALLGNDKQFFLSEYQLTIPSWNGFSLSPDGSNGSWQNVRLGSKLKLIENNRKELIAGIWEELSDEKDYVVVGIERNPNHPETILKLHNLRRFAVSPSDEAPLSMKEHDELQGNELDYDASIVAVHETTEVIYGGSAMMQNSDETVSNLLPKSNCMGRFVGIALHDALTAELIAIKRNGIVKSSHYNFIPNQNVFIRLADVDGLNLSQAPLLLENVSVDEDAYMVVGMALTSNSFEIKYREFTYV
ncbi:MAG: hypothetical protein M9949_04600 [Candidatus Kapabacteria bacterium]|nr:hypothetical protein [Candidatus Kapabacteria bacterium]